MKLACTKTFQAALYIGMYQENLSTYKIAIL